MRITIRERNTVGDYSKMDRKMDSGWSMKMTSFLKRDQDITKMIKKLKICNSVVIIHKNIIMKKIILLIFVLVVNTSYAATEQWISSTGSGATYEEAKTYALRNALELAFGTFISSNTVIRNDILQKDEIVGISTGNIKKFTEISKAVINGRYCVTLNVLVSPEKLASFVQSQGMVVEYQGESFASNIKIQMMNEKSEKQAMETLANYAKLVYSQCFEYDLKAKDPYQYMADAWKIKMELSVKANKNFDNLYYHIIKSLVSISLNSGDIETRKKMGKYPYVIVIQNSVAQNKFMLRTNESRIILWNLFGDDLLNALGSIRIAMDAGSYSRNIEFSDFKLLKDGGEKYIVINSGGDPNSMRENELTNILNSYKFTYISFDVNKYSGIFAKFSYDLLLKGQNSIDAISNIKGFKVIK
jgi:tRNA-binding EMAP/Myf-like protein